MKVVSYSSKPYDQQALSKEFDSTWQTLYLEVSLDLNTLSYAQNAEVVTAFVNDRLDKKVLNLLAAGGTKLIALRCSGFNHVDLATAANRVDSRRPTTFFDRRIPDADIIAVYLCG